MKKNLIVIKKAWRLNQHEEVWVHANTRNEAKTKIIKEFAYYLDDYISPKLTYLKMNVVRHYDEDLVIYDGEIVLRHLAENRKLVRHHNERLFVMKADHNITHCYIMKRGTYYVQSKAGYTSFIERAGIFSKSEAIKEAYSIPEITLVPINILEHNKRITTLINELETKIINNS